MEHSVADDPQNRRGVPHTTILGALKFSRRSIIFQNTKKIDIFHYEINEESSEVQVFSADFRDNLSYGPVGVAKIHGSPKKMKVT